jgi:hypothetical protein
MTIIIGYYERKWVPCEDGGFMSEKYWCLDHAPSEDPYKDPDLEPVYAGEFWSEDDSKCKVPSCADCGERIVLKKEQLVKVLNGLRELWLREQKEENERQEGKD